jgi:hypothetical protein
MSSGTAHFSTEWRGSFCPMTWAGTVLLIDAFLRPAA